VVGELNMTTQCLAANKEKRKMSARGLQTLLATTLTDQQRRELLLNHCPAAYDGFDLSVHEMSDLLAIEAQTLEEFAAQAHCLFYGEDLAVEETPSSSASAIQLPELGCA
jgi:hypothetical protein